MSGAGNTFLFGKLRDWPILLAFTPEQKTNFIKKICSNENGFSADGLVLMEPLGDVFRWHFYNSDGSDAEMCGNAARCAAIYLQQFFAPTQVNFVLETKAGLVATQILSSGEVVVQMPPVSQPEMSWEIEYANGKRTFFITNTGVPHAVLELPSLTISEELTKLAQWVRQHPFFRPSGTNVTFYSKTNGEEIDAVTFERGVEGFTKACGTGAVAAARAFRKRTGANLALVSMPGGKLLIEINGKESKMTGPALFVGQVQPAKEN